MALGDYRGGKLWIWPGVEHGVHKPTEFDGTLPHITLPHRGERYSLVFFSGRVRFPADPDDAEALKALGQPPLREPGKCQDVRSDLLEAAAAKLRHLSPSFIGDYRNVHIKSRYHA